MTRRTAKAGYFTKMEISTRANGRMTKLMVRVSTCIQMAHSMLEIGMKISSMGREQRLGPMEPYLKEPMPMVKNTVKEVSLGPTIAHTPDLLLKTILKVMVFTIGVTEESTRVTGKLTRWKAKAYSLGLMAVDTRVPTSTTRR